VIKVHLDVDIEGYRPTPGEKDITGAIIPDQHYNQKDFDQNLVIDERTKRVARWVSDFLKWSSPPMSRRASRIRAPSIVLSGPSFGPRQAIEHARVVGLTSDGEGAFIDR
jgi:hypothetical protein